MCLLSLHDLPHTSRAKPLIPQTSHKIPTALQKNTLVLISRQALPTKKKEGETKDPESYTTAHHARAWRPLSHAEASGTQGVRGHTEMEAMPSLPGVGRRTNTPTQPFWPTTGFGHPNSLSAWRRNSPGARNSGPHWLHSSAGSALSNPAHCDVHPRRLRAASAGPWRMRAGSPAGAVAPRAVDLRRRQARPHGHRRGRLFGCRRAERRAALHALHRHGLPRGGPRCGRE